MSLLRDGAVAADGLAIFVDIALERNDISSLDRWKQPLLLR